MRINYNVSAMLANNNLSNNDDLLSRSIERLSSGLKINGAKDNPAGLAMAKRMNGQIVGTQTANANANDGISVIETADGALSEVHDMLHRMTELATKASNDINTDDDRKIIQEEIDQLKTEINRVAKSTQFNGQNLLDGSFSLKAYTTNNDVKISNQSAEVAAGDYRVGGISWTVLDAEAGTFEAIFTPAAGGNFPSNNSSDYTVTMNDNYVNVAGLNGFEMTFELKEEDVFDSNGQPKSGAYGAFGVNVTGMGPMRLQIGSNEGQIMSVDIPEVSLGNMGIAKLDVSTTKGAQTAIDRLEYATNYINSVRGKLGAYQNRLESATENLGVVDENLTSAYSRIMDVDMAEEMTAYSSYNVIVQAATSVLAQANERPSSVLQLLQ